jgi:hypothetical protein
MNRRTSVMIALVGALAVAGPAPLDGLAQGRGQGPAQPTQPQPQRPQPQPGQAGRQPPMQQHMIQMQDMMRDMDRIASRAGQLSQQFAEQQSRLRDQDRDRVRLVQQMCDSLQATAQETRRSMDRVHRMMQDRTLTRDEAMMRDVDRLREHLRTSGDNLQETLRTLERIQDRLRTRVPSEN